MAAQTLSVAERWTGRLQWARQAFQPEVEAEEPSD
jgi:hypothetical protein